MDTEKQSQWPLQVFFYCYVTHVMSQVLHPKSVNKQYRGATCLSKVTLMFISVYCQNHQLLYNDAVTLNGNIKIV